MNPPPEHATLRRVVLPAAWLIAIYLITWLAADIEPPPRNFWERVWFEAYHIFAHSFVYAVQIGLLAGALRLTPAAVRPRARLFVPLLALMAVLGLGQETLQSLLRSHITVSGSLFDLLVDTGGAWLGTIAYARWRPLRWLARFPAWRDPELTT